MTKLIAFHNDPQLKADLLEEVKRHRLADQIIKGTYGTGGNGDWKGCAVGCSLHSLNKIRGFDYDTGDHASVEEGAGVPRQIAYLQDYIFENLQDGLHLTWPERFWTAIQPGTDLELVTPRFVHWLLTDSLPLVKEEWRDVREVFTQTIALYERWIGGDKPSDDEFSKVAARAALAARAARVSQQSEKLLELLASAPIYAESAA